MQTQAPEQTEAGTKEAHTPDMSRLRSKDAKLSLKLKADSGYSCDMDARVSAEQWATINRIVEGDGLAEAAAPDLLAALKELCLAANEIDMPNRRMLDAILASAAAISRAEA